MGKKDNIELVIPEQFKEVSATEQAMAAYWLLWWPSSGKSTTVALLLLRKATMKSRLRILCCREIQNSIADSVHKLRVLTLLAICRLPRLAGYRENASATATARRLSLREFITTPRASSYRGYRHLFYRRKRKAYRKNSIDILIPTIRKAGSYFVWCWNPLTEQDPSGLRSQASQTSALIFARSTLRILSNLLSPEVIHERRCAEITPTYSPMFG